MVVVIVVMAAMAMAAMAVTRSRVGQSDYRRLSKIQSCLHVLIANLPPLLTQI